MEKQQATEIQAKAAWLRGELIAFANHYAPKIDEALSDINRREPQALGLMFAVISCGAMLTHMQCTDGALGVAGVINQIAILFPEEFKTFFDKVRPVVQELIPGINLEK